MALDGFVIKAIVEELSETITNSRIHKIYQPHPLDLVLVTRGNRKNNNLLISANPTYSRIHITDTNYINPLEPPMFCMLLRKHLEGGVITNISQIDNERIIHIDFKVRNEIGDILTKTLIVEIMGRHSNIILVNDKNIILDGINHVSQAISRHRQILPGKEYIKPPEQNKVNPFFVDRKHFLTKIKLNEGKIDKQLVDNFTGMSPTIAKEIIAKSGLPTGENLWNTFSDIIEKIKIKDYHHTIVSSNEKEDFSIIELSNLNGKIKSFPSINECLDEFYKNKAEKDIIKQKTSDLTKFLNNEKIKNEKKTEKLLHELEEADNSEQLKLFGELITANLYQIKKGFNEVKVINYYSESQDEVTIPLDPIKSPNENAQSYFKKYNKLKTSKKFIDTQLVKTKEENNYIDTILTQIENANIKDVEEIREELISEGYLKEKNKKLRKKKKEPELLKIISSEGITIYVGKNNIQNDYLTNKIASHLDTWLHTKDIPGSHVVIKEKNFGEKTLLEAAMLAAYYSKGKNSSNVPVDYTLIKHVKKPNGAKPGFVIYDKQKTLYVTPNEELINKLMLNAKK